jgi:hypothetical protein
LTRLVEIITRNFGEKRLTGAVFLDVAKVFDTIWISGLLYKLMILNFLSYLVHTISSYLGGWTFEASFQTATSSGRGMRAGVAQGGLISPVPFSLYVNDMPTPLYHVELALYADNTAIIATSRKLTLLVSFLKSYLIDLQWWLSEWRITINISQSTVMIITWAVRCFIQAQALILFRESIHWVDTTHLVVTLDTQLTWSPHIYQVRNKTAQGIGMLGALLNRRSDLSIRNGVIAAHPLYDGLCVPCMEVCCLHPCPEAAGVTIQVCLPSYRCPLVRK